MSDSCRAFFLSLQTSSLDSVRLDTSTCSTPTRAHGVPAGRPGRHRRPHDVYGFSTADLRATRADVPKEERPGQADYWLRHRKGFAVDVVPHEIKCHAPFP
ncbi:hypothetical protein PR202_gb04759 [Eleusine coracana subsp. coracana]|uniref:Uncharacterized protein n=1 Tax=Eleusine coracana subsp. coracana TaxID=191504 RepID=A0AAV5E4J1_ELECO|nr:hypothetical protein PR202_gb04759 [Eleusine coracana subsp. coracana]